MNRPRLTLVDRVVLFAIAGAVVAFWTWVVQ